MFPSTLTGFLALIAVVSAIIMVQYIPLKKNMDKRLKNVKNWACQLQGVNFQELLDLEVDLLVVDADDSGLSREQVYTLKETGKLVLAYLCVGGAEEWRDYWRESWREKPPAWLGEPDPRWPGSYRVKFWRREWWEIVHKQLGKILALGYDGAFLDLVDVYRYWESRGIHHAKGTMIGLIESLSREAKQTNPNFIIIAHNCPELILAKKFSESVDGIGVESLWYLYGKPRPRSQVNWVLDYLDAAVDMGKVVLVIEYLDEPEKIKDFFHKARRRGYVPYVGTPLLDRICHIYWGQGEPRRRSTAMRNAVEMASAISNPVNRVPENQGGAISIGNSGISTRSKTTDAASNSLLKSSSFTCPPFTNSLPPAVRKRRTRLSPRRDMFSLISSWSTSQERMRHDVMCVMWSFMGSPNMISNSCTPRLRDGIITLLLEKSG